MKKLAISLVLILTLSINVFAYENFDIFEKDTEEITLEQATEYMLAKSSGAKNAEFNKKRTGVLIDTTDDQLDQAKELDQLQSQLSQMASQAGKDAPILSAPDGLQLSLAEIRRDFAKTQKDDNYKAEINALKYGLRKKYFTTLQAKDLYNIKNDSLEIAKTSLAELEKKFELGLINELDLEQGRIAKESAELGLLDAKKMLNLARMDLNNYMGFDLYKNLILVDELEEVDLSKRSPEETIKLALENNNNVKGIIFSNAINKRNYDGLVLRYSMFSPTISSAKLKLEEGEKNLEDIKVGLELDAQNKYMSMLLNKYYVDLAKKELEQANRQKEAVELAYELGLKTYLDVKGANTNLEAKKMELSDKVLKYNLSVDDYELLSTVGTTIVPLN